jgi:hypothetical protein
MYAGFGITSPNAKRPMLFKFTGHSYANNIYNKRLTKREKEREYNASQIPLIK